jgi:hypothetical protein
MPYSLWSVADVDDAIRFSLSHGKRIAHPELKGKLGLEESLRGSQALKAEAVGPCREHLRQPHRLGADFPRLDPEHNQIAYREQRGSVFDPPGALPAVEEERARHIADRYLADVVNTQIHGVPSRILG